MVMEFTESVKVREWFAEQKRTNAGEGGKMWDMGQRVFLLSPARCSGERANLVYRKQASFPLAVRLREGLATLGETFTFLSGLYFRGKLGYANRFAADSTGVWIMT